MTIKTKLLLSIFAAVVLISVAGLVIYQKIQQIDREIGHTNIATKIVQVATTRRGLVFDYYRFHEERPKTQWQLLADAQTKLTQSNVFSNSEHQPLLAQINATSEQVKSLFAELVANYEKPKSSPEEFALAKELEQVLVSQLMENIQANITRAYILSDDNLANVQTAQAALVFTAGVGVIVLLLFLVVLFFFFNQSIAKPLIKLKEAAMRIASLDFSTTTTTTTTTTGKNNEIGQLARAFNTMTEKLKESYVTLEKKVRERTQSLERAKIATLNVLEDLQIEKSKVEMDKAKDEAILSSIGDAVMACDTDGKIVLFNKIASELSGFSIKEAVGHHYNQILSFIKEDESKQSQDFIGQAIKEGKMKTMANHTMIVKKDGTKIPVADSAAPIFDKSGQVTGCVVVFRDVSKERQIDRIKSEFISVASHQLRTPLTGIKWFSELLIGQKAGKLAAKQTDFVQQIYNSNERMIRLVNDLLDVSHIETGQKFTIEKKSGDVIVLINKAIKDQKINWPTKKIMIKLDESCPAKLVLSFDQDKIYQVFSNLINNSIKYSGSDIKITVGLKRSGDQVQFFVKDFGLGIPSNQQDRIFQKFFRADNIATISTDGTGLGLYIVKDIVEAHGGKIWFESAQNKGTTFYFTLPIK